MFQNSALGNTHFAIGSFWPLAGAKMPFVHCFQHKMMSFGFPHMIVQENDSCRQKWISDPKTELYIIIYHVDTQKTPFYTENHAQMASGRPPGAKKCQNNHFRGRKHNGRMGIS